MVSQKKSRNGKIAAWTELDDMFRKNVPHVRSWWSDSDAFSEVRVKARDDGTFLVVAKGYGSDGGPVVCFGVGYDVASAFMAVDATIQGGRWKVDKPWAPKGV